MLKFKNSTKDKTPYALHAEQVHSKFPLCFNKAEFFLEIYIFLILLVGYSTKHFL